MSRKSEAQDEVKRAELAASKLLAAAERAARKRERESLAERQPSSSTTNVAKEGVPNEASLNRACAMAKSAHMAKPDDKALAAAYTAAKQAFRDFQAAKRAAAGSWTCELCGMTMPADEATKALHLQGKAHRKKQQAADAATSLAESHSAPIAGLYKCHLCACSLAESARETHESGAKHRAKFGELKGLWQAGELKRGDWVCTAHGWHVQANFASRDTCKRSACRSSKSDSLSYDTVQEILGAAAEIAAPASANARRKGTASDNTEGMPHDATSTTAAAASVVVASSSDMEFKCRDCNASFNFGVEEQTFYQERLFAWPTRCASCRSKKRQKAT